MNVLLDRLTVALADRYRIERELGAGGMATELVTEVTARRMSLKRPSPSVTPAPGVRRGKVAGALFAWIPAFSGLTTTLRTGIRNV